MFLVFEYAYIWLPVLLLIVAVVGTIWAIREDRRDWNNGRCVKHARLWIRFDVDSQGGRGYKCDKTWHKDMCSTWISWWADKNYVV